MISNILNDETGIYRLQYSPDGDDLIWDQHQQCLVLPFASTTDNAQQRNIEIRLDTFTYFMHDLHKIDNSFKKNLSAFSKELIENQARCPDDIWREALGRFAFLLLRSDLKGKKGFDRIARNILQWLGPESEETAWRIQFDENLSFEKRYSLIETSRRSLASQTAQDNGLYTSDLTYKTARELYWWTVRSQYELALKWYEHEGKSNYSAQHALREASLVYLQFLKDEPRRQDLERFLSESGLSIEDQVKRVFSLQEGLWQRLKTRIKALSLRNLHNIFSRKSRNWNRVNVYNDDSLIFDEAVRRIFFAWFLKRYDLRSAKKLILFTCPSYERIFWRFSIGFAILSFVLFLKQISWLPLSLKTTIWIFDLQTPLIWFIQILIQLSFLLLIFLGARTLSPLLMPRALFGSLLAWLTIILTTIPSLQQINIGSESQTLQEVCHSNIIGHPISSIIFPSLPVLILSLIFVKSEVDGCVRSNIVAIRRSVAVLARFVLGALFWGIVFAMPIKKILEAHPNPQCNCIFQIAWVGSSFAVLFGIILQLLWEDKSITEPLDEPL